MARDSDGAYLAHISDTLAEHSQQLGTIHAVLGQMLSAIEAQTEMLTEVLQAARSEPANSPVAQALTKLSAAVAENTNAVATMAETMGELARLLPDEPGHEAPAEG